MEEAIDAALAANPDVELLGPFTAKDSGVDSVRIKKKQFASCTPTWECFLSTTSCLPRRGAISKGPLLTPDPKLIIN